MPEAASSPRCKEVCVLMISGGVCQSKDAEEEWREGSRLERFICHHIRGGQPTRHGHEWTYTPAL